MTKEEVKKVAHLARIELTKDEVEKYSRELTDILKYVDQLQEVDTEKVPITSQVTGLTNVFREDKVEECGVKQELLDQAPEIEEGGVKVKSVF